ncbi:protein dispatched 1 [Biomphalaria glabrata]|nr:protein dispatched-like protein 1-like [Biomphalaria glabrata]KAI8788525.1 protein dispatched 1 [Biomphalaria glabrata]
MCRWYARILAHYPYIIILVVLTVVTTCLVLTITLGSRIDFDDPIAGFEPRGTELADRLVTFANLRQNVGNQTNLLPESKVTDNRPSSTVKKKPKRTSFNNNTDKKHTRWRSNMHNKTNANIFCGVPDKSYPRLVVESTHGRSLFNFEDIQAICEMESHYFLHYESYEDLCFPNPVDGFCCTAWTLGSYIAVLSDRASCEHITAEDVASVQSLMLECAPFFHSGTLKINCDNEQEEWYFDTNYPLSACSDVPLKCTKYNAVAHIFYYLTDSDFMHTRTPPLSSNKPMSFLKYSTLFLPVSSGESALDLFKELDSMPRDYKTIKIVAAEFNVKYLLFEEYLISDSMWLSGACAAIFIVMWLYTSSVFITIMAFLSLFWAVDIAYCLYTFVFNIKFFPYMNMVTLVVLVGIGADDLFIYCKVWRLAKSEKNNGVLEKLVLDTLRHAVMSMLVTSLTTASAFYANYISDITAIRCFSVFAGTCIVMNFVLTLTWLPASIMLEEKWLRCFTNMNNKKYSILYCLCKFPYRLYYWICDWSRIFFEKILPCLVIKFRFVWLIMFSIFWIGSIVIIFFYPRLKLPTSDKFQVFSSDHLLERYDLQVGKQFRFESNKNNEDRQQFFVSVVWGVLAKDNGDPLNPSNKGSLTFDPEFNITSPEAQKWILQFCARIRHTDFYLHMSSYTDCFFERFFKEFMAQDCSNLQVGDVECCNRTGFPIPADKLMDCLSVYISLLQHTPGVQYNNHSPGPRFSNRKISAYFVQLASNYSYSTSYEEAHTFYSKVNQWVNNELLYAPPGMRRGWFVSDLHFYDLQSSLAMGTPLTLGLSLSIVAVVSFFTTLNVLISIYAFMAVAASISVTLASLVLMDWELNLLESVIITIAVGLAIDITLHYGVAYRLAPDIGKEMRVITSVGRMGSPVAMATFTTMLAGALIMPSTVLAYQKFGTFLLLLVSLAWLYATFFFQSLLRIMGPNGGCGQFHWPASDCCMQGTRGHVDKTVYAFSDSTVSTSSTSTREQSQSQNYYTSHHELEPLTGQDHHLQSHQMPHSNNNIPYGCPQHLDQHNHHHPRRKGDYLTVKSSSTPLSTSGNTPASPSASSIDKHQLILTLDSIPAS